MQLNKTAYDATFSARWNTSETFRNLSTNIADFFITYWLHITIISFHIKLIASFVNHYHYHTLKLCEIHPQSISMRQILMITR